MGKNNALGIVFLFVKFFFVSILILCFLINLRHFKLDDLVNIFKTRYFTRILYNSFFISIGTVIFSFIVGFFTSLLIYNREFALKGILCKTIQIPYVMPSIIIIMAMTSIFGVSGLFKAGKILYSKTGVILTLSYYCFPLVFINTFTSLSQKKYDNEEAFQTLGASKFLSFLLITLPNIFKPVLSSLILVFLNSFFSFSIVLTFGGLKLSNIESEVYKTFLVGNYPLYSILCFISIAFSIIFSFVYSYVVRNRSRVEFNKSFTKKKIDKLLYKILYNLLSSVLLVIILLPLVCIFSGAFVYKKEISFYNFSLIFGKYLMDVLNSTIFSIIVSVFTTTLAIIISAYSRRTRKNIFCISLMASLSGVVLSSTFAKFNYYSLFFIHIFLTLPFAYYLLANEYSSYRTLYLECERMFSGNELLNVFYVEAINFRQSILNILTLTFAISLCDVSSTLVLSRGKFNTISTLMYQAVSRYNFNQACAFAFVIGVFVYIYYVFCNLMTLFFQK